MRNFIGVFLLLGLLIVGLGGCAGEIIPEQNDNSETVPFTLFQGDTEIWGVATSQDQAAEKVREELLPYQEITADPLTVKTQEANQDFRVAMLDPGTGALFKCFVRSERISPTETEIYICYSQQARAIICIYQGDEPGAEDDSYCFPVQM
jgi:hypothetical protein